VLLCAELIDEAFLRQSAFSVTDRYCSVEKQIAMMQLINRFIDLSAEAVAGGTAVQDIHALPVTRRLRRMGEEIDADELEQDVSALRQSLEAAFARLGGEGRPDAG
jgi:V/A-type H+-transporting ATPase subunit A